MTDVGANSAKTMKKIFFGRFLVIGLSILVLLTTLYVLVWNITNSTHKLITMNQENAKIQTSIQDSYLWFAKMSSSVITGTNNYLPGTLKSEDMSFLNMPDISNKLNTINSAGVSIESYIKSGNIELAKNIYSTTLGPAFEEYMTTLTNVINQRAGSFSQAEGQFTITIFITRVMVVVTVLVVTTLLWMTYGYIVRDVMVPVSHIKQEVEKLAKGDLKLDARVNCKNKELLTLGTGLTFAAEELKRYIDAITLAMNSFKKGDFTMDCPIEFLGDFVEIKTNIEDFQDKMSRVLAKIDETSAQVYTSAEQVSGVSQNLADGAVTQASTVEELAANINSITEQITQNAENAKQANMLGSKTSEVIARGKDEMNELMHAMKEIEKASANIGNIINTIDNIAFQTNILALNAAVEAARAGQAGKGFGVVADEVRSLAQKSAEAAKSTTELIEHSLAAVTKGISLANNTNDAFERVIVNSNDVLEVVDKIAVASKEQADSITHFSVGIEQVSGVVQMNSATSEESAAASQELSSQATHLKRLIEQFKIKRSFDENISEHHANDMYHTNSHQQHSYSKY